MWRQNQAGTLWGVFIVSAALYGAQSVLATYGGLTLRYAVSVVLTGGMAWLLHRRVRRSEQRLSVPVPDPISLALAGMGALGLWPVAWWLMDGTNYVLEREVGLLARPISITVLADHLLGINLNPVTYELGIVFAVVLLPLVQSWLLWGQVWREVATLSGYKHGVWITGVAGGVMMALSAIQDVSPAMPWGMAAVPGYVLVGLGASLGVYLTGSFWAGFAAQATFAYASFAWRDDLFWEFAGVGYLDVRWLTVIVLGGLVAGVCYQVIRFRTERPGGAPQPTGQSSATQWLPVIMLLVLCGLMIARDLDARSARPLSVVPISHAAQE